MFKLKQNGTSVWAEILGGFTTFFAMAYIIFVNPNYLSVTGMDYTAVMVATCLSAALGTLLTAFIANVPFAQAPGMGLNAFFTFTVATAGLGFGMGFTWQQALLIVLISGIIFLIISATPLRKYVINAIPASLKSAIGAGIGLFIAIIGLLNSGTGIMKLDQANHITGMQLTLDGALNKDAMLILIGIAIIAILMAFKLKGAILYGIIISTLIGIPMGVTDISALTGFKFSDLNYLESLKSVESTWIANWDWDEVLTIFEASKLPLAITAVVSFFIVDMFDTIGTLIGTATGAGMVDEEGNMKGLDRALIADAIATCTGACLGTSTVTTFVESSAGVSVGARTGLSSVVVAVLFLGAIVLAPIAGVIPGAATAPALVIVGALMVKGAIAKIEWNNIEIAIPAFLTIIMMPFAYSISDGIAFGFISYTLIKMFKLKFKEVPVFLYVFSGIFILVYIMKIANGLI